MSRRGCSDAKADFTMSRVDGSFKSREAHGFRGCSDDVRTRLLSPRATNRVNPVLDVQIAISQPSPPQQSHTHTLQIACNNTFRRQQHEKTPAKRRKRIVKCEKWSCSRRIDHFFAPKQRQGTRPKRDCPQRQAGTPVLQSRLSSTTCTAPPQHTSPLIAPPPSSRPSPRPRLASVRLPPHILSHLTAAGTRCCSAEQSRPGSSHPSRDDSITSAFRQPTSRTHPSPDCMFMRHLQHNHA